MGKLSKEASKEFDKAMEAMERLIVQLDRDSQAQSAKDVRDTKDTLDGIRDVIVGNIKTAA